MPINIDWRRVAKPQEDSYDTFILGQFMHEKFGWSKRTPASDTLTMCRGTVEVGRHKDGYSSTVLMDVYTQPELVKQLPECIAQIDEHLSLWDVGYISLTQFLDEFYPRYWPQTDDPTRMKIPMRGSASGHVVMSAEQVKNGVYITINDAWGCGSGIYHEVGHLRLNALGLFIENHDFLLIQNGPDELYDSPVRFDVKRPMCAVIQGLYAWMMLSEKDIQVTIQRPQFTQGICDAFLRTNIPKIENGLREVRNYVRPTEDGRPFIDGLLEWGDDIVTRGKNILVRQILQPQHNTPHRS